jgi:outer membrane protein TolC
MYKEGFVEETDVKQLQISVNELENNIRSLETQIQITMRLLKLQMGLELDHPIHLTEKLSDLLLSDMDIQSRMEQSFDPHENIGLQTLITREQLAGLSLKKEKTTFLPTLSAFASIQRDAQRDKFNIFDTNEKWYPTTVVGVQLSWPLFNGSAKIIKIQKAQIELKKARLQREKAESGLRLEFEQARNKLDEANDQYKNAIRNRDLAKDVYETNLEKFKEGIATSLELTQVHNQYLKAESGYLQAVSNLLTARTQLDKILETL